VDISKNRIKQIIKEEVEEMHDNSEERDYDDKDYEWASVKAHLDKIHHLSRVINDRMQEPDDGVEEWVQEKIAVISAMLHSINHYQEEERVRSS